jgi:hypothetical protein
MKVDAMLGAANDKSAFRNLIRSCLRDKMTKLRKQYLATAAAVGVTDDLEYVKDMIEVLASLLEVRKLIENIC